MIATTCVVNEVTDVTDIEGFGTRRSAHRVQAAQRKTACLGDCSTKPSMTYESGLTVSCSGDEFVSRHMGAPVHFTALFPLIIS
jgi:hypothetical protein